MTTEHSCTLKVFLDVANVQCDCDACFLIHNEEEDEQQSITSERFQHINEGSVPFELSTHKLSKKTVGFDNVSRLLYGQAIN